MPPANNKYRKFRWTFGSRHYDGYRQVRHQGKVHMVHRLVCRAFHGLPPVDKPFCDHKSRIKAENCASNLHWVSCKENNDNADCVDRSISKYGARACEDKKAYMKGYDAAHREDKKAYMKTYCEAHREDKKAYDKVHGDAYRAKKKDQGLTYRKGPDGKYGWHPRINP